MCFKRYVIAKLKKNGNMSADDAVKAYRRTVAGRNAATSDHKLKSIAKK